MNRSSLITEIKKLGLENLNNNKDKSAKGNADLVVINPELNTFLATQFAPTK